MVKKQVEVEYVKKIVKKNKKGIAFFRGM